jgi:VWFA-related protein
LVLLLLDFTSMEPAEAARSLRAAETYVRTIGPADRVAVVSLAAKLEVQQDFTGDRSDLEQALRRLHGLSRIVLEANRRAGVLDDPVPGASIVEWRLRSLHALSKTLAQVPQKKSIVIFAGNTGSATDLSGIGRTIDAAVRANVTYYGIDAGGLTATPPLGDASTASSFGVSVLSGAAVAHGDALHQQDLLYTLARGTGGRAFFASNDFARPFRMLERDTREYYVVSYRSSNLQADDRYRRISVRVRRGGLHLIYPSGYYRPGDAKPQIRHKP